MFVALLAVALSPVFPRFWCRSFCPAGAFLSLLGGLHLLRRCTPEVHPKACVYGVRDQNELDCLRCDRCRRLAAPEAPALQESEAAAGWQRIDKLFLAAVLGFALLFVALAVPVLRAALHNAGTTTVGSGAVMRTVDMPKLKTLLDADELSNHEAKYYRPADPPVPGPATRQPHPGTP
jgi:hypothetical protein